MMKLYLLERVEQADWDQYDGFVIAAESPEAARILANREVTEYDNCDWTNEDQVSCRRIAETSIFFQETVVISDFNAG